ncbi:MAG TPA: dihydrodipicolinate synthase family protein [Tepidisphaeraceae bacterium]|nr:dihydrodipicolinate synthase family protein [Tepidisphaeraceae bacterium]
MPTSLTEKLTRSVLAVPPLARSADLRVDEAENTKLIRHIEAGGVRTLLYGGNANFYHIAPSEFDQVLGYLESAADRETLVIPSVGPAYGTMMDQAKVLRRHKFETVMVLPQQGITTAEGVETGIRQFVQAAGIPAVVYVKNEGYIEPENIKRLVDEGLVSGIKYAIVRNDTTKDAYLSKLVQVIDPKIIISGIGEQPAIIHLRDFRLGGFTSGCVCVAPRLSAQMLEALRAQNWSEAERIREIFRPLEDLRNEINPIRVLHEAVSLAGIGQTGPLIPLMSNVAQADHARIADAARRLLKLESDARNAPVR